MRTKQIFTVLCATSLVGALGAGGTGCLSRDVISREPTTKSSFTTAVPNKAVDKIDLLLAVDNSASMGDKQKFLAAAVPELVKRLVTPSCIDDAGKRIGPSTLSNGKATCATGKPEFEAINDIHIGIVSSSLGGFGGSACADDPKYTNNDLGHLVARQGAKAVAKIEPSNFLAWYPPAERTNGSPAPRAPYTNVTDLSESSQSLITGNGEKGCGLEAQLESVYHFLMAPDPWQKVKLVDRPGSLQAGTYDGLDTALLTQRKDFLRTDSLVAVIMLSDEDDSSPDVMAAQGTGWLFDNIDSNNGDFRATAACADFDPVGDNQGKGPNAPTCSTCLFASNAADSECQKNVRYTAAEDDANVRYIHMKQRFGIDPQFPISRYVRGFSQKKVPSREKEHDAAGNYIGDKNSTCTNPLFAKDVADGSGETCNVAVGDRDANLVFFAMVGGVPNELLHYDPNSADNSKLTSADWDKILGHDPLTFNYTGIDPRMVQSITPRANRPAPGSADSNGADPLNLTHREWNTKGSDLQFACTFALPPAYQKPFVAGDPNFDCADGSDVPLCSGPSTLKGRSQIRAKAYPTVRQFMIARALGDQGIAASLCPQETSDTASPLYGYTPAVTAIVDRLKNALTGSCLPQKPTVNDQGLIDCLMLEVLPDGIAACDPALGTKVPDPVILQKFRDGLIASGDADKAKRTICEVSQIKVDPGTDCSGGDAPGWCYVSGAPAGRCGQKVNFQKSTLANGSTVYLQCIDQSKETAATP